MGLQFVDTSNMDEGFIELSPGVHNVTIDKVTITTSEFNNEVIRNIEILFKSKSSKNVSIAECHRENINFSNFDRKTPGQQEFLFKRLTHIFSKAVDMTADSILELITTDQTFLSKDYKKNPLGILLFKSTVLKGSNKVEEYLNPLQCAMFNTTGRSYEEDFDQMVDNIKILLEKAGRPISIKLCKVMKVDKKSKEVISAAGFNLIKMPYVDNVNGSLVYKESVDTIYDISYTNWKNSGGNSNVSMGGLSEAPAANNDNIDLPF